MPWWARLGLAFALFWLFLWLSPQFYYTYYRMVIPGLPAQIVIQDPPSLRLFAETLTFTHRTTLADHARGFVGWVLLAATLWPRRKAED